MTEQCERCNGTGEVDSGAPDPQGHFIKIPCECHTKHVHEWKLHRQGLGGHITIRCSNEQCAGWLTIEQAEARLNEYETLKAATERLSAEDAKEAERFVPSWEVKHNQIKDALKAYANILEGKDE